ncbi:prolyl oligopeptidase family serine peptidase [Kitasatospora sp. NBC_01300]|uniref:prolyl oligopeptidase family serine peptidase n=1 Tax=Kitasatospora sp. NBC_01300 TaxID=2903574 RepID=UPI00352F8CDF|nr:prolyl oligopeptidase family serine peptidase [Kitasatospora sp. NBC_01300]
MADPDQPAVPLGPAPGSPVPLGPALTAPADPYRWLEDMDAPRTRAWLAAQQRLLDARPQRADEPAWTALIDRVGQEAPDRTPTPPAEAGGLVFRHERRPDGDLLTVQRPDGTRHALLDDAVRRTDRIAGWSADPSGRLVAVQLHRDGRENGGLHLLPTRPGERPRHLPDAAPYATLAFAGDALLYTAGTRTEHALTARHLSDGTTRRLALPVPGPVRLTLYGGPGGFLLLRTRPQPSGPARWWATRWTGEAAPDWQALDLTGFRVTALDLNESVCFLAADRLLTLDLAAVARGAADRPAPMEAPPADDGPAPAGLFTPADPFTVDAMPTADALSAVGGANAGQVTALRVLGPGRTPRLAVLRRIGTTHRLDLHRPGAVADRVTALHWSARLRLGVTPYDGQGKVGGAVWLLADDPRYGTWIRRLDGFGPIAMPERRAALRTLTAVSRDGTPVPVTLCDPEPQARHRPAPTVLTVYGGFGIPLEPSWDPAMEAWLRAGGRIAWVHARGGGELGPTWAAAGRGAGKSATVDDFRAAAAMLVERGEAQAGQLGALAASNGALVIAAALTREPGLFSAAVCVAPLADLARYQVGGLGRLWTEEYGDPTDPQALRALLDYSPYHRVEPGTAYPAVLLVTGANDARVPPWHSWKLCAALGRATTGEAPVLLDHHDSGGHQGRQGADAWELAARALAVLGAGTGLRPPSGPSGPQL